MPTTDNTNLPSANDADRFRQGWWACFWNLLCEEHARWKYTGPPIARSHYERAKRMMEDVDYVLSPSSFVRKSFLDRGFRPERILKNVYTGLTLPRRSSAK